MLFRSGRSIGDTRQTAEINDYSFERFSLGGNLTAHATVKNTGNTDFTTHYSYTAKTFFGKVLDERSGEIATYPGLNIMLTLIGITPHTLVSSK